MLVAVMQVANTATAGVAANTPELLKTRNCAACHLATQTLIGPSYKALASRYSGKSDIAAQLIRSVVDGSRGRWGAVPMPANRQVTPEEAQLLVTWILNQR
jgi:cytochrome c